MSGFHVDTHNLNRLAQGLIEFANETIALDVLPSLGDEGQMLGDPDVTLAFKRTTGSLHNTIADLRDGIIDSSIVLHQAALHYERAEDTIAREAGY